MCGVETDYNPLLPRTRGEILIPSSEMGYPSVNLITTLRQMTLSRLTRIT
jgi:hypothetical protein